MRYDTVTHKGLSVSPRYHGIQYVIDNVLAEDWEHGEEGSSVPELITEDDCVVRNPCLASVKLTLSFTFFCQIGLL